MSFNQTTLKKLRNQEEKEAKAKEQLQQAKADSKKLKQELLVGLAEELMEKLNTTDVQVAHDAIQNLSPQSASGDKEV
ncbi:hypothetical protein FEFB_05970 [Fructobacillus sp. EFB-N1]|uniref:hypothetical protein n=1 Tax=Fructobacillus sp. EFB-N1 TaxID=1658766 RepID=UPI00064D989D|nr:hypothetical protein [Fructobacillus sp. EFB-N1]KMK53662.1 hypothetical protein FEFB_05970 [Fructobacillus sp. EFB-N1]